MRKFILIFASAIVIMLLTLIKANAQWTVVGTDIYPTTASYYVGIGITPATKLDISPPNLNLAYGINGNCVLQNWGTQNIFCGVYAGYNYLAGADGNSFFGYAAGYSNTASGGNAGTYNVFAGAYAGYSNTTGENNVFIGSFAGLSNQTGLANVFIGRDAGYSNQGGSMLGGSFNTVTGREAFYSNISGKENCIYGKAAGYNVTGTGNCFFGFHSGYECTGAYHNVYIGDFSQHDLGNSYLTLDNSIAIGANSLVTADDQMILGGLKLANNSNGVPNSVFCGIGLSGNGPASNLPGPQNSLEINADPLRVPPSSSTATGLRFRQVRNDPGNNTFTSPTQQTYNQTTIQPWGKVLTVDKNGDVGLTENAGNMGLCKNPNLALPYLYDDIRLHLTDPTSGPITPHRIYYEDQTDISGWNSYDAIGLGYNCSDQLPGKLSVKQDNSAAAEVTGNTVAGHFHNRDIVHDFSNIEKTGVYGISDNAADNDVDYNIGGDFEGLNSVSYNIGVRGRASRNYTLAAGSFNAGGDFEATSAASTGQPYGSYSTATFGFSSVGAYGEADYSSYANTGVQGVTLGNSKVNYGVCGQSSLTNVHPAGSLNVGVYGEVTIDFSCASTNYAVYGDLGGFIPCPSCSSYCPGPGANFAGYFNGDLVSTSAIYVVSDSLLKDSISPISSSFSNASFTSILSKLHPSSYTFKQQQNLSLVLPQGRHFGIMAQELQRAGLGNLVKQAIQPARFDSAGNQTYAADTFKTVNMTELIPFCVGGLNELQVHQQQMDSVHTLDSLNIATMQFTITDITNQLQQLQSIVATCCNSGGSGGRRADTTGSNNQSKGDGNGTVTLTISDESNTAILGQNIPNPANGSTIIPFRIPQNCNSAAIMITEVETGKMVNTIPVNCKETNLSIEAGSIATGTYSYSLYIDGKLVDTKKMVLTK